MTSEVAEWVESIELKSDDSVGDCAGSSAGKMVGVGTAEAVVPGTVSELVGAAAGEQHSPCAEVNFIEAQLQSVHEQSGALFHALLTSPMRRRLIIGD